MEQLLQYTRKFGSLAEHRKWINVKRKQLQSDLTWILQILSLCHKFHLEKSKLGINTRTECTVMECSDQVLRIACHKNNFC